MGTLDTEILVIGSGAGGAPLRPPRRGRQVTVVEEGPGWSRAHEPFSLEEMVAKYRHHGASLALGNPNIAYAEGRCVGGSTEVNSGLYHRLPDRSPPLGGATPSTSSARGARPPCRPRRAGPRRLDPAGRAAAVVGDARAGRPSWLAPRRVRPGVPLRRRGPRHQADDVAHVLPAWAQGRDHRRLRCNGWCARATGPSAAGRRPTRWRPEGS